MLKVFKSLSISPSVVNNIMKLEFTADGRLKLPDGMKIEKRKFEEKEEDYIFILKSINEIPFSLGKKLLIDFLKGNTSNKSIIKNRMDKMSSFDSMHFYTEEKIAEMIENMISKGMLKLASREENEFSKILILTAKGKNEIVSPTLINKKLKFSFSGITEITEKDQEIFTALDSLLHSFNEPQKKAIIETNDKILCIAGAGSGKTSVLVKRIEFLVNYRSVPEEKILAITFTRKARQEMESRLRALNLASVSVETFNSFCERILKQNNSVLYGKESRVMNYSDKIEALKYSLSVLNLNLEQAIELYFTDQQKKNKNYEELFNIFLNDCFFIIDYFKSRREPLSDFSGKADSNDKNTAKMIFDICKNLEDYMIDRGLRDYTDQIIDALMLFKSNKESLPQFDHILVDEYQDVNSLQVELLDLLNSKNSFFVGDPRQSIFGWRGSDISYIINFQEKYPSSSIIYLSRNYRSGKKIVDLINSAIRNMDLPDLINENTSEEQIELKNFETEQDELNYVIGKILEATEPRNEIFVLARTNRQLKELSFLMKKENISHVLRSDEIRTTVQAKENDVTLATIHAIKGLEAKKVFVIGCTSQNFPCKASDHPVIEIVKAEEYDKEEEERRLFYVALSRAKEKLFLSYSGKKPTYFLNEEMKAIINKKELNNIFDDDPPVSMVERIKSWRKNKAEEESVPAYCIFNDATLHELIEKRPHSPQELESIRGLGFTKIRKYGEEILGLIS